MCSSDLFVRAAIVVIAFLNLSRDGTTAAGTVQEAGERKLMFSSPLWLAFDMHDFLHIVEQSLADNWLEVPWKQLAVHADNTVVDMMLEHLLDVGDRENLAFTCA